jgi:RHS repeat-associated protein
VLRFPGQYGDKETNLAYNWMRDYDPSTGRYVQSDPTGLEASLNTYAYLDDTPLTDSDFYGLIKGTMRGFKRKPCPAEERVECADRCKAQGKVMKSCMVTRGVRWIVQGGTAVQQLYTVPGSMSCECTDCEDDGALKKFWNWLTKPRYKDDDPFGPYTGGSTKPVNPIGPPPPGRWAPGFGLP